MCKEFPEILKEFHKIDIDYADGEGIDFEPYDEFYSKSETSEWFKAWTGNMAVTGEQFSIFGQDGSGGLVAFWHVREADNILNQPIVFLGSEGEKGIIAQNFKSYIWLFANGIGPYEAVAYPDIEISPSKEFIEFANEHAPNSKATTMTIIEQAKAEFPKFEEHIDELCC